MYRQSFRSLIIIFLIFSILLASCSGSGDSPHDENPAGESAGTESAPAGSSQGIGAEQQVTYEPLILRTDLPGNLYSAAFSGEKFYYSAFGTDGSEGIAAISLTDGVSRDFAGSVSTSVICGMEEGILVVEAAGDEWDGNGYELRTFDASGSEVQSLPLTGLDGRPQNLLSLADGKVLLTTGKTIGRIDPASGEVTSLQTDSGIESIDALAVVGEQIYYCGYGADGHSQVAVQGGAPLTGMPDYPAGIFSDGKDLYVYDSEGFGQYDFSQQQMIRLAKWADLDVPDLWPVCMTGGADGFYAFLRDPGNTDSCLLGIFPEGSERLAAKQEKQREITISTLYSNTGLESAVGTYNRENPGIQIRLVDYSALYGYEDGRTKLTLALQTGEIDGIVDLSGLYLPAEKLLKDGYVIDQAPFLEADPDLSSEDYEEPVLDICRDGDRIAAIPYAFYLDTLLVDAEKCGLTEPGWTPEQAIRYAEKNPGAALIMTNTPEGILGCLLRYDIRQYYDAEAGTCSFDSEEFRRILEYAASYSGQPALDRNRGQGAFVEEGKVLIWNLSFIDDMKTFEEAYDKVGETPVFIGYPTRDGTPCSGIDISPNGSALAISGLCRDPEAAWDFIRHYLLHDPGQNDYGLPSNKRMLETIFEWQSSAYGPLDGVEIYHGSDLNDVTHPLTPEEIAQFRNVLDGAVRLTNLERKICYFVLEEATPYFAGQKSMEECIAVLESRTKLYLSEQMTTSQ